MGTKKDKLSAQIEDMTKKMKSQMPRIKKEIRLYEQKASMGTLTKNPKGSPQFN